MKYLFVLILTFNLFTQVTDESYFNFLTLEKVRLNSSYEKFYTDELIKFIDMYPESEKAKRALKIVGDIKFANKDYHQALVFYLKIKFLFSNLMIEDTKQKINQIITDEEERDYEKKLNQIELIMSSTYDGNLMDNSYQYIKSLFEISIEEYYPYILKESRNYLNLFPGSINNDNILLIVAKTYELMREEEKAMFYYEMMVSNFPNSPQLSFAKYQIASLLVNEFKEYAKAIDVFTEVVNNDPDYEFAHEAQFQIGRLYQEEIDQNEPAINNYNKYLTNYADKVHAVQSLFNIANIQNDDDLYESEIETLRRITTNYLTHPRAPEAQLRIKDLYSNRLKDKTKTAEEYVKFAQLFPKHEDAAEMIYDGIEIYIEDLKKLQEAKDALKILQTSYPESSYTEKSKELIDEFIKENPQAVEAIKSGETDSLKSILD